MYACYSKPCKLLWCATAWYAMLCAAQPLAAPHTASTRQATVPSVHQSQAQHVYAIIVLGAGCQWPARRASQTYGKPALPKIRKSVPAQRTCRHSCGTCSA